MAGTLRETPPPPLPEVWSPKVLTVWLTILSEIVE
jgi:hypothetical protein